VCEQDAEENIGPKREELARGCGSLHNEELHNFVSFVKYYYGDQIKGDEMGGACSTYGRDEKCIRYCGWKI
jgi:hypothetical protein